MKLISHLMDAALNKFFYKNAPGEISWYPEDFSKTGEIDGYLIIRTPDGFIEVSYAMANRHVARRQTGAVLMRVMTAAILEGMKPVAFRVNGKLVSPYSKLPMSEDQFWPNGVNSSRMMSAA